MLKIILITLGLVLFSGCSSMKGESTGEYIDDSTITAKVTTLIEQDPNTHYLKIDVTTTRGDVVLQGFVNSSTTEAQLLMKIKEIKGVKSIKSLLRLEEKK